MNEIMESDLEQLLQSKKIVIVDFSAVWCHPCKNLGKILETKVSPLLTGKDNVVLVKIDIDKNQNLAQQLQVLSVPTIMFFFNKQRVVFQGRQGSEDRIVGFLPNIDEIIMKIVNTLEKQ
jgi:thioredoxin-like negative regulator of GroEL